MRYQPLVLVSNDKKLIKEYLKEKLKENHHFFSVEPKEKKYSIDDIRLIEKEIYQYQPILRVYFFENFHLSSIEAQNSFLKLLEEPPKNILFILTVDNQQKILPTILSRVKTVYLKKTITLSEEKKKILDELLKLKKIDLNKSEELEIDDLILFLKEKLRKNPHLAPFLKEVLKLKKLLENNNLNKRQTLDFILIKMLKMNLV